MDKGAQSSPVIHTNVSYPTLSLMLQCNNIPSCGYLATNSTTLDLPLSSITGLTDGFEQVTETPSSGLFNRMQAYQYGYRMAIGHYGTATQGPTYADLSRNNSPYNIAGGCSVLAGSPSVSHSWCAKFDAITAIIQYAVASGTYADVPAETYTGGEIDTTNGETATQAELDMVTEASTFCSDVKAVEAAYEPGHVQIQCPVIIPDQITSNWVDGTATSYVSIGEFQAARDYPSQIAVSVAKYAFQYAGGALDHRHLTGISESDLGEYQAQAIQTIVRNNSTWQAPQPTAAHLVDATDIHMPVAVPFPPLVIDATWWGPAVSAADGITLLYTKAGAPTPPNITGVSIASSGTEIDITTDATVDLTQLPVVQTAPATGATGTVGCTTMGSGSCVGTGTPIRDSNPLTPLVDVSLCTAVGVPWGCCTSAGHGADCNSGVHLYDPLLVFSIAVTT